MERYEPVKDLGSGNFGVAKLMRDRLNDELVAIKFIERGERVDRNVEREICNHRMLNHPNIVGFKEVFLTPSHLGIVMEYAAGGELFERIVRAGRFSEDEARYFFQQLISGVSYCHRSGVCHRDLKLENTLLDGNAAPRLKICDFGYSKSVNDSQPKSTVGTPAYIAPEVLQRREYNGQHADVWSCGVTLFVMLVGAYPFEDPADPRNFRRTIERIMNVTFSFPPNLPISPECQDLIARIFVANPSQRITINEIRNHPWFLRNLPAELADSSQYARNPEPHQSPDEIRELIRRARTVGDMPCPRGVPTQPLEFNEDDYMDADIGGAEGGAHGAGMAGRMGLGDSGCGGDGGMGRQLGDGEGGLTMAGTSYLVMGDAGPYGHVAAAHGGQLIGLAGGAGGGPAAYMQLHAGHHAHEAGRQGLGLAVGLGGVQVGVGGMGLGMGMGMQHVQGGMVGGLAGLGLPDGYGGGGGGGGGAGAGGGGGYLTLPPSRGYPPASASVQQQYQQQQHQMAAVNGGGMYGVRQVLVASRGAGGGEVDYSSTSYGSSSTQTHSHHHSSHSQQPYQ